MSVEKIKERAITAIAIAAIIVAGLAFWKLVAVFMWMCYDAGIPM